MTELIKGKNGNQWQFISDENDIETIFKKLDLILEHNARVSALYLKTQEDKWLTAALEQDIDILDKKLDFICDMVMNLYSHNNIVSDDVIQRYMEIFKNESKK